MLHRHECERCGCVWEHDPAEIVAYVDPTPAVAAHVCPECGQRNQWDEYTGPKPAQHSHHHRKTLDLSLTWGKPLSNMTFEPENGSPPNGEG